MEIAVQESVDVGAGQGRGIRRHTEHGNAIADFDIRVHQALKNAFDEDIDWLASFGREDRHPLRQTIVERDACRHVLSLEPL
jgi:hypothetical protein